MVAKMTQAIDQKHTVEEHILREQVKQVCNHITSGVAEMNHKHGVKFILPSGWQNDLEDNTSSQSDAKQYVINAKN